MNSLVTEYINNSPLHQKEIMEVIRKMIHQTIENVTEDFKWNRPIFKVSKAFAYLQANKNHVNLGFYQDAEKFDDPEGKLEGTGKTMRHIKLENVSDINHHQLNDWFLKIKELQNN